MAKIKEKLLAQYPDDTDEVMLEYEQQEEWDNFKEYLSDIMAKKGRFGHKTYSMFWRVEGRQMGWLNKTGYKYLKAETGGELLEGILPDCDCSIYIYRSKLGIKVKVAHHDSPMGEWYYVRPITEKTYDKNKNYA